MTDIVEVIKKIGAIKQQKVTLASGENSQSYLDLRLLFGKPKQLAKVLEAFKKLILERIELFDGFVTIPTAGLPFATYLAVRLDKPLFYVRDSEKEHGLGNRIEGGDVSGLKLVLIDDLISSGYSKLPAVYALREAGAIIEDVCVVVDRELGGAINIKQHGLNLHAIVTISEFDQVT